MPNLWNKRQLTSYRFFLILSLSIVTPLGFASKAYQGIGREWFNNYAGAILYEIFWILLIMLIWRNLSPLGVSVGVLLVTCFLEVLQLWQPPFLQAMRETFIGRTLLGTTFVWWDFPYYILGCLIGWLWVRYVQKYCTRNIN